jgi:hypothetical protein
MKNLFFLFPVLLLAGTMLSIPEANVSNRSIKTNHRSPENVWALFQRNYTASPAFNPVASSVNAGDTTKPVKVQPKKLPVPPANNPPAEAPGNMVLYDVTLNYIAVSEATRNRIDNGDCKRVFGQIKTELWELDQNNNKKTKLSAYDNMTEDMYSQPDYRYPPTAALSYYQDNRAEAASNNMGRVTYNIPERLLTRRKVMLVVKSYLGTRHKDNDLASYDALRMRNEETTNYVLDSRGTRSETMQAITYYLGSDMILGPLRIPHTVFARTDDTHKLWVAFTCKLNRN